MSTNLQHTKSADHNGSKEQASICSQRHADYFSVQTIWNAVTKEVLLLPLTGLLF